MLMGVGGWTGRVVRRWLSERDATRAMASQNLNDNQRLWEAYAKRWPRRHSAIEDPALRAAGNGRLARVGDEWGVAADIDRIVGEFIRPFVAADSVVAEIGVGGGRIASRIARDCNRLYCFDISRRMLAHARRALKDHGNIEYVLLDQSRIDPAFTAFFDFVYAFDVFVHLDLHEMWKYFLAFRMMLKDGAKVFIHTTNLRADGGWDRFVRQAAYSVEGHYFISPEIVSILSERSGLRIVKASTNDATNFYLHRDYMAVLQKPAAATNIASDIISARRRPSSPGRTPRPDHAE